MIKVGLMGNGKAGQTVAQVLCDDPRVDLHWIGRRAAASPQDTLPDRAIAIIGLDRFAQA